MFALKLLQKFQLFTIYRTLVITGGYLRLFFLAATFVRENQTREKRQGARYNRVPRNVPARIKSTVKPGGERNVFPQLR